MKLLNLHCLEANPVILYVFLCDLPKCAVVQVKPMLLVEEDAIIEEIPDDRVMLAPKYKSNPFDSCVKLAKWHDRCVQNCFVHGRLCTVLLSVTPEIAKVCSNVSISTNVNGLLVKHHPRRK